MPLQPPINFKQTKNQAGPPVPSTHAAGQGLKADNVNATDTNVLTSVPTGLIHYPTQSTVLLGDPPKVKREYEGFKMFYQANILHLTEQSFLSPIPDSYRRPGFIYLYTRDSDPGYVKIGMTLQPKLATRQKDIKGHCKFDPKYHIIIPNVMYAPRVELMIHRELEYMGLRRIEPLCKFGSLNKDGDYEPENPLLCSGNHQEWFEMPVDGIMGARQVIERWVNFFRIAQPYDLTDGTLKAEYRDRILSIPGSMRLLSSNVMMAMWAEMQSPRAVNLRHLNRQVIWTYRAAEKRRTFFFRVENNNINNNNNNNTAAATGDGGDMTGGCSRSWFSDCPGEKISLGCENLAHEGRKCVSEMVSLFWPHQGM